MAKHKTLTGTHVTRYTGMYEDGWTFSNVMFELKQPSQPADLIVSGVVPQINDERFTTELTVKLNGRDAHKATLSPGGFDLKFPCFPVVTHRKIELKFSKTQTLSPADKRMVGALLNQVGFESPPSDIYSSTDGVELGDNWYPAEKWAGETFRWVNNDAEIILTGSGQLKLVVESGPGLESQPFELKALGANEKLLTSVKVIDRNPIVLILPPDNNYVKLHVEGGGKNAPSEKRVLNFRVFQIFLS